MLKSIACAIISFTMVLSIVPKIFANEEYKTVDWYYDLKDENINRESSKRFQIVWGNEGNIDREEVKKTLNLLEEVCDYFVEELNFNEPTQMAYGNDKTKYKVNVYISGTGLVHHKSGYAYQGTKWIDGGGMFGYIVVEYGALKNSYVMAHEFAHVCQLHSGGGFANNNPTSGPFWEMYADYMSGKFHHKDNGSTLNVNTLSHNHLYFPHGKNYYNCWFLAEYFDENEALVGKNFNARIWKESIQDEFPFDTIKRLLPIGTDFKDVIGDYARKAAALDFKMRDLYLSLKNEWIEKGYLDIRQVYPQLEKISDKEGFWKVPHEYAPMQGGFNAIRLIPEDTKIFVFLQGVKNLKDSNQDFRASLVAIDEKTNKIRYSPLFSEGEMSMSLSPTEKEVYLVVAATPNEFYPVCTFDITEGTQYNVDKAKIRYLYEVSLKGAKPYENTFSDEGERIHKNGGGKVASTAYVSDTAYVAKDAKVLGNAKVLDNAKILDHAVIMNNAVIKDNAIVSGHAVVKKNATVMENAKVRDYATITDTAMVFGNGKVIEHAYVSGSSKISENATARGSASFGGKTKITGFGMIDGDYIGDNLEVSQTVAFGRTPSQDFINKRPKVLENLFSEFLFYKDFDYAIDSYSSSIGIFRGNIPYIEYDDGKSGIVSLNGGNYILFGNEISDFKDVIYELNVKWTGDKNEKLLTLGTHDEYVYFSPSKNGKSAFVLVKNKEEYPLYAEGELSKDKWTNIKINIQKNQIKVFENDKEIINGKLDFILDELRNDFGNANPKTLNKLGGNFNGLIDSFYVYSNSSFSQSKINGYHFEGGVIYDSNNAKVLDGIYKNAVDLNGDESHVRLPDGITYGIDDFTISFYVKPSSIDNWARVFDIGYDTGNYAMFTPSDGDKCARFEIYAGTRQSLIANQPLKKGVWQHVLITKKERNIAMYIDKKEVARRDDYPITLSDIGYSSVNYLGKSKYNDPYFNGLIDEFEIIPYALTQEEVLEYKPYLTIIKKDILDDKVDLILKNTTSKDKKIIFNINQFDENNNLLKSTSKSITIKKGEEISDFINYQKHEKAKKVEVDYIEN